MSGGKKKGGRKVGTGQVSPSVDGGCVRSIQVDTICEEVTTMDCRQEEKVVCKDKKVAKLYEYCRSYGHHIHHHSRGGHEKNVKVFSLKLIDLSKYDKSPPKTVTFHSHYLKCIPTFLMSGQGYVRLSNDFSLTGLGKRSAVLCDNIPVVRVEGGCNTVPHTVCQEVPREECRQVSIPQLQCN